MVWLQKPRLLASALILFSASSFTGFAFAANVVLMDFSSVGCGPCRQMRPTVQRLAAAGFQVRHVDIGREPELAAQFHVDLVPTFIALVDGREAGRITGLTSYEQLARLLTPPGALRGQSPDRPRTSPVLSVGATSDPRSAAQRPADLNTPQPGRVLDIQSPQRRPSATPPPPIGRPGSRPLNDPSGSDIRNSQLVEASVKIAVEDADGTSAGTGTIVDARDGAALILTCGHLFRSSAGKGPITVTLFSATASGTQLRETVPGQLLHFDLEQDLALVIIRPQQRVAVSRIASPATALGPGLAVRSVGCNQGANPTVVSSRITTVDRYQGAPNVEVAGAPVEGRSGGGLFNAAGELIGVCFAADPQSNEGLYASLRAIVAKLDELNLAMVYQTPGGDSIDQTPDTTATATGPGQQVSVRGQDALVDLDVATPPKADAAPVSTNLSAEEQAALEEIRRRGANSEVICIIRPRDPEAKSEVITLKNVSPQFVGALIQPAQHASPSAATAAAGQLLR